MIAKRSRSGTRHMACFLADHSPVRRIGLLVFVSRKMEETASFLRE